MEMVKKGMPLRVEIGSELFSVAGGAGSYFESGFITEVSVETRSVPATVLFSASIVSSNRELQFLSVTAIAGTKGL